MNKLVMVFIGCLAYVSMFYGTALSANSLEPYFGDYVYEEGSSCAGSLTLSKGGRDSYLIVVDNSCGDEERVGLCGGDFLVSIIENTNDGAVLRDSEYGITFAVGAKGVTVDNVPSGVCGMGAYMHGEYLRGKTPPASPPEKKIEVPPSANKFDGLAITFITWRGAGYPLSITTKQFTSWLAMRDITSSWEEIDQYSQVLHLTAYDKVQKNTEKYRLLFETKEGAARAIVTRCFFYESELTGPERDNTFLPLFIAADGELSQPHQ